MKQANKKAVTAATEHGKEMCVYNTNLHEIIVHAISENVKSNFERSVESWKIETDM